MNTMYNFMIKIDLKDRKILYQLDIDSRQPLSTIGKKVGLPKTVVAYRINKLKEKGIIKSFYTVIDAFKLGYTSLRFYLTYQYTTPEIEKEIVDYFKKNKHTWWLGTFEGRFDLAVIMWVKDLNDFYSFWKKTLKKFRYYFQEQVFSLYVMLYLYRYSYLLEDYVESDRTKFEITGGGKKVKTDDLDFHILKLMAENARMPVTKIAKNLNSTVTVINYRIKKLMRLGVIQGFRVNYDFSKLGYQWFKLDIDLKEYEKKEQIIDYIKSNPHLIIIDESAGVSDLELEFHLESLNKLHDIMEDIIAKFPNVVKNYRYIYAVKVHKMHYMPEE
ncbi:MAG: Lrp/AsnC family transcriptional regulator [Thermoplasmatales archaeon]|nr:MAG: Lrp/AsnC family transcriptional regulator [Thermoplasmatales archaeon]